MGTGLAEPLHATVAHQGFAFVEGYEMKELLARAGSFSDWDRFARSWSDLALDTYMGDGGRYRRRRHAVYEAGPGDSIVRGAHQPHYQSRDYNTLNGGIARWFEPIDSSIGVGATMQTILAWSRAFFETLTACRHWHVEAHQFRIEARAAELGRPTPEGMHRDGVDYVIVLLVDRLNIASGTTTVHDVDGREVGSFTLTAPLDAALLDDAKVAHGVTPIQPVDPDRPAYRDVLVVTWLDLAHRLTPSSSHR
jgi:hypothetical protein